jgi:hypothetical protein
LGSVHEHGSRRTPEDSGHHTYWIAGVATSIGVESTARQAHEHGFNVTLATDAMTDMDLDAHRHGVTRKAERRTATTKTVRETEAEAVAFVVGKAVGLVTGTASADYIQLYHGNASPLAESLEVIQQTASVILAALDQPPSRTSLQNRPPKRAGIRGGGLMQTILEILRRPGGGTTASVSRQITRHIWSWSSRRPTSQDHAAYLSFL